MSEVAIRVDNLGKKFLIGHRVEGDLRGSFAEKIRKLMGQSNGQLREEFWALKDVSFEIKKGEAVGIIGRNGAGKSTLLKILSRITDPTTGRFEINGRVSSLLEVGTGFHSELTGRENIYLNGTILGMRRAEIKKKFDAIVDFSGVEKFIDTPVKHYSSGMKVRLAFSVAAHLEPEILIVDEVLAVGDAEFQKKCLGKMDEVSKAEGRTILFVSHNMGAVKSLCTKGILLHKSRIEYLGDVNTAITTYLSQTNNKKGNKCVKNYVLNEKCVLEEFQLNQFEISTFENFDYKIVIRNEAPNKISEMALLFYSEHQERVAIIDLRHESLHKFSETHNRITVDGSVRDIPFIEGTYYLGLYLASNLCTGNFLEIIKFDISGKEVAIAPYPVNVRGYVEMKNHFSIYG